MEQFEINLVGETYTIKPLENGEYQVNLGHYVQGVLIPKVGDLGVTWSGGGINNDLARQLGELIEEHDM